MTDERPREGTATTVQGSEANDAVQSLPAPAEADGVVPPPASAPDPVIEPLGQPGAMRGATRVSTNVVPTSMPVSPTPAGRPAMNPPPPPNSVGYVLAPTPPRRS